MAASTDATTDRADRAAGAIMGVLIGDGLGMGFQWYYDLKLKEQDFGEWVDSYVDPKPDGTHGFGYVSKYRYEQGMRAGDISQLAQVCSFLVQSTADKGGFDRADFLSRLDALYGTLSGESLSGRYTDGLYIQTRAARLQGKAWGVDTATKETTSDGCVLSVVLAALYDDPAQLIDACFSLLEPLLSDTFIVQNSIIFALVAQALINGVPVSGLGKAIIELARIPEHRARLGAFDTFLTPSYGAVTDPSGTHTVFVEPPKNISLLFGLDCQVTHISPCAYFLVNRFPDDFENAVLSATNGGGQNVARGALTGALSGAAVGLSRIPQRFLVGLKGGDDFLKAATAVAALHTLKTLPSGLRVENKAKKIIGALSGKQLLIPDDSYGYPKCSVFTASGADEATQKRIEEIQRMLPFPGASGEAVSDYPNMLNHRFTFGLFLPSTNTTMEQECWTILGKARDSAPEAMGGIGMHTVNILTPKPKVGTPAEVATYRDAFLSGMESALGTMKHAQPQYYLMGMSMEHILESFEEVKRPMDAFAAKLSGQGLATWHEAAACALRKFNAKKIAMMTPFDPSGMQTAKKVFEQMGFEVVSFIGFGCGSTLDIGHVPHEAKVKAVEVLASSAPDAVIQCGTNFSMLPVITEMEPKVKVPILGINQTLLWYALREVGFAAKVEGCGRLFAEH